MNPETGDPRIWYGPNGTPHASFNVIVHQMRGHPKDGRDESVEEERVKNDHPQPNHVVPPAPTAVGLIDDPLADYQSA